MDADITMTLILFAALALSGAWVIIVDHKERMDISPRVRARRNAVKRRRKDAARRRARRKRVIT